VLGDLGALGDPVIRDPAVPFLDRDGELHSREVRAEAAMGTRAEREVTIPRSVDDESVARSRRQWLRRPASPSSVLLDNDEVFR